MRSISDLLCDLKAAAPLRAERLTEEQIEQLRVLTRELLELKPQAPAEYRRFEGVRGRGIDLPHQELLARLEGRVVLITGGTGCIGRVLLRELMPYHPARVVSVTRGRTPLPDVQASPWLAGVEFVHGDVRHRAGLDELFDEVRPDVVFHVAAQRDPGRAETEVRRTVATNVFGTLNVVRSAARVGTGTVVCASTGKALRPYSPDVYAASKRVGEWMLARTAAACELRLSASRFTHVVDNSIVGDRLRAWCAADEPIRLHSAEIGFYIQSALESAHLLLCGVVDSQPGQLRINALRDLDWPASLLEVALGAIAQTGSDAPIYIAGYDEGYEEQPFPGLYDPMTAGDVSPLINVFEAPGAKPASAEQADTFVPAVLGADHEALRALAALEAACAASTGPGGAPEVCEQEVRARLDEVSWALLEATVAEIPEPARARVVRLAERSVAALPVQHPHHRFLETLRPKA
ncbi:SDR family NAD(P)-dependent oxidoreductase [Actinospica durhamensis]|uniref:SDR family NAD(P)-dependent oxidoreductase n=1 Tax=Actinospica durhamensis TaxID=1508375 RepID=A0A941EYL1_9ACTN|nr:SDR family NAD(P)-dependent oxidoreductase [Actinospica durhamensis]MBR7836389.1 SDR family NAD(P)-dependent oxidoreductase [Actinospica durhamensis]